MTRKQAAFVHQLVSDPKLSATEAAARTYGKPGKEMTRHTAESIASENLRKPEIMLELAKHSNTAENVILEVMTRSKEMMNTDSARAVDWATNARQTADSLLDRVHGKATQRTEVNVQSTNITIDLTGGEFGAPPPEMMTDGSQR